MLTRSLRAQTSRKSKCSVYLPRLITMSMLLVQCSEPVPSPIREVGPLSHVFREENSLDNDMRIAGTAINAIQMTGSTSRPKDFRLTVVELVFFAPLVHRGDQLRYHAICIRPLGEGVLFFGNAEQKFPLLL